MPRQKGAIADPRAARRRNYVDKTRSRDERSHNKSRSGPGSVSKPKKTKVTAKPKKHKRGKKAVSRTDAGSFSDDDDLRTHSFRVVDGPIHHTHKPRAIAPDSADFSITNVLESNPVPKFRGENSRIIARMWDDMADLHAQMVHIHKKRTAVALRRWLHYPNDSGAFLFLDDMLGFTADGRVSKRRAIECFRHFFRSHKHVEYLRTLDLLSAYRRVDVDDTGFLLVDNDEHIEFFRECLLIMLAKLEREISGSVSSESSEESLTESSGGPRTKGLEPELTQSPSSSHGPGFFSEVVVSDKSASSSDSPTPYFASVRVSSEESYTDPLGDGPIFGATSSSESTSGRGFFTGVGLSSESSSTGPLFPVDSIEDSESSSAFYYLENTAGDRRRVSRVEMDKPLFESSSSESSDSSSSSS